ncbi:MAG: peptidylprolyl isomerase [Acidobacteriaceae bacterium]|nr:peptidylprolyl isomerase [Acidobacteriaceae bacterium]
MQPTTAPNAPAPAPASSAQLKPRGPEAVAQRDPNRVVAVIDGKQITAQQALDLLKPLPPQERQRFQSQLPQLVQQIYMQHQIADEATKLNLDQQSPWKEQLQMARANILTQAYFNQMSKNASSTPGQDPKQYYDSHQDEFDQVKLSGIIIGFNPPGTSASNPNVTRSEQEAQQKADDLEKKIKAGNDFTALARTESDNKQSAAKGGDLGTFTTGDAGLPPSVKDVMVKLQSGQVSEPIRIPNGFLIIKVDSRTKQSFDQARAGIVQKLQNEKNQAALKQEVDKYKIQVQDPDFFNASTAPAPNIPSLQKPTSPQASQPQPKPPAQ